MKETSPKKEVAPASDAAPAPPPRKMRFFWQGDARWRHDALGLGNSTMAAAGCLVTSLTLAAHWLSVKTLEFTPGDANQLLKKHAHCWSGSNLIMPLAARHLGLSCPADKRLRAPFGDPGLKKLLEETLKAGDAAIIHVSTDGDPKDGGEHFILAYQLTEAGEVLCADPALGASVTLPLQKLEAKVMWREKPKLYQVVSVAPVSSAPTESSAPKATMARSEVTK